MRGHSLAQNMMLSFKTALSSGRRGGAQFSTRGAEVLALLRPCAPPLCHASTFIVPPVQAHARARGAAPLAAAAVLTPALDVAAADASTTASVTEAVAAAVADPLAVSAFTAHPGFWPHLWPPYGIARGMEALHAFGGLEWWSAIAIASVAIRVVALPFFVRTTHTGALMQHHQATMSAITDELSLARKAGDAERMRALTTQYKNFMTEAGINPLSGILTPLVVQTTLAISAFTATRRLAADGAYVAGVTNTIPFPLLGGGATPWLLGVHLPDPTFILPIASGVFSIAAICLNKTIAGLPQAELTAPGQRLLFSGFAGLFTVATAFMPASQQIYIATTAGMMLIQQSALRVRAFRDALSFPSDWPLSPEVMAERAAKRSAAGLDAGSPMIDGLKGFTPLFRRASDLAAGQWRGRPSHSYISVWGLRDPGAPPPPAGDPPSGAPAVAPPAATAAAAIAAVSASAAPAAAAAGVVGVGVSTRRPATATQLLTHRPKKKA